MTIAEREAGLLKIAHVVSDTVSSEHLRVLQILAHACADETLMVVHHGSRLCRWSQRAGIPVREAGLAHAPSPWMPCFDGLADLLWRYDPDAVHIHGHDIAGAALAAARWLDLPVIFTPAAGTGGTVAAPRFRLFAGLFGRDPSRRADGLMLLEEPAAAALAASGKPVLQIPPGMPADRVVARYRALLEEIDRRTGREPRGAPPLAVRTA